MPDELEERLRSHARSFDSLLSLIPAKLYYGEDVSDQWKRKKQTSEQKRAAKMAKLDPDNWKSAKDVLDERAAAAKRKREDDDEETALPNGLQIEPERPKILQEQERKAKKQKVDNTQDPTTEAARSQGQFSSIEEKKAQQAKKKLAKQQAKQKLKEKKQRQKDRKAQAQLTLDQADNSWVDVDEETEMTETVQLEPAPSDEPADIVLVDTASTASSSTGIMDVMSPPAESGSSSISSVQPEQPTHSVTSSSKSKSKYQNPTAVKISHGDVLEAVSTEADKTAARDRLSAAISSFRSQRKADANPRSRQDLLNARRLKEESRRTAKKEQRRKEREEAARLADEEIERRFSPGGSGSLLGSPRSPTTPLANEESNSFNFGRITFGDGSEIDPSTSNSLSEKHKKRGPQDTTTALQAIKNKQERLAGFDQDKRKQIEEKDMWLNAKKRAHGERVKDDSSLLKKALKRQEAQKKKSEKEWSDRKDGIQKAQEAKQKKRTNNLAKRKEERKHGKKVGTKSKKVKRPGFEGSFRGRTGGTKKK